MLIKLKDAVTKTDYYVDHAAIVMITPAPQGAMIYVMDFGHFSVQLSPDGVKKLIDEATIQTIRNAEDMRAKAR